MGFDPYGANAATSVLATGAKPFNATKTHAFNWIAPAYAAVRGSFNWNFVAINESAGTTAPHSIHVKRVPATLGVQETDQVVGVNSTKTTPLSAASGAFGSQTNYWSTPCRSWWAISKGATTAGPQNDVSWQLTTINNTTSGAAAAVTNLTGGVSVTMPHYNSTLFDPTTPAAITFVSDDPFQTGNGLYQLDVVSQPSQGQTTRCFRIEKWARITISPWQLPE